jgi:hypothetical protein
LSPTSSAQPSLTTKREVYEAILTPVNAGVSGATGTARVVVDQDQVGFFIEGAKLDPGMMHMQNIHPGTSCATLANDSNGDGIVDSIESNGVSGAPVFPLTLNLERPTISLTLEDYPVPSQDGNFNYIASTTVSALQSALGPMSSPSASMSASPGPTTGPSGLALEGRVIEIYGISADTPLPSTAQGAARMTANNSLPVACGRIVKVAE